MRKDVDADDGAPRYLRAQSVARLLDCHISTIWRLVQAGRLPEPVRVGRMTLWRAADVVAAVERQGEGAS